MYEIYFNLRISCLKVIVFARNISSKCIKIDANQYILKEIGERGGAEKKYIPELLSIREV